MRSSTALFAASIAAALATAGCTPQPPAATAAVNDKVYTLTPDTLKVRAGIVAGEVSEMKIVERVEEGSGRIAADQSVRLLGGKIVYLDGQGRAIPLDAEVPAAALPKGKLKDIRLDIAYIPPAYKQGALSFPVSLGGQ